MAYAHKVVRVTCFGTMFGGAEEWSTGFFLGASATDASIPTQAGADMVRDAWGTLFGTPNMGIASAWQAVGVKLARLGTDGKTELDNVETSYFASPVSGAGGGSPFPPQVALVATLIAESGKGLGGKGRMYLPGVKHGIDGGGKLGSTEAGYISLALKTFFDTVNGSFDTPGQLINASQGRGGLTPTFPLNRGITSVRVGNVYDTQRRRRNALVESYNSRDLI